MKILILDEEFPWPQNNGKRTRSFSLARVLAGSADLTYLAYGHRDCGAVKAMEEAGMRCEAVEPPDRRQSGLRFYLRLGANLLSGLPYIVTSHYTRRFAVTLQRLMREEQYDLVICEWSPYAIFLKEIPQARSIIVAHNIESLIWARYEENETNPLRRWYIRRQRIKVERFEAECFGWADGATAVSDAEARLIQGFGLDYRVETIENGVDVAFFRPTDGAPDPGSLIFSGAMDWRPNQDAVEYFAGEILPLVQAEVTDAEFRVVGREPSPAILALDDVPGVSITGTVDDVRPYMARASLCVVPLRIGGGSRLKILAAMAMGKPVVSTSIGAEGLHVTDGEDILIADGAEQFARTVIDALGDPQRVASIAARGRSLVVARYQWDSLGAKLYAYLREIVGKA